MILQKENRTKKIISKNGNTHLVSSIDIINAGRVEDIYVGINVEHNSFEDLNIKLISPSGKELVLHDNTAKISSNLQVKYNREVLESFIGEEANGEWQLKIKNRDPEINGILNSWVIGMSCTDQEEQTSNIYLKDNNVNGLNSQQHCQLDGMVNGLVLDVFVEHPFIGDLTVVLTAPSGKSVTVHDRKGGERTNLRATYNIATLKAMLNEQCKGEWALCIKDHSPKDAGRLKSWRLNLNVRHNENLTRIEGISAQIQHLLYGHGINTFAQVVSTSTLKLRAILKDAGYTSHDPSTWPSQAQMAAMGQWNELTDWQQNLKLGVVTTVKATARQASKTIKVEAPTQTRTRTIYSVTPRETLTRTRSHSRTQNYKYIKV